MQLRRLFTAVLASASLATLVGCSATERAQPFVPAPGAAGAALPATTQTLVYACEFTANECIWYAHGRNAVAGTLAGLSLPSGIGVDAAGDVYVANFGAQDVPVYAKGSTTLVRTLDDTGHLPIDVKVDPNGTVYVANLQDLNSASGSISVYAPGSTTISRIITDPNFGTLTGLAVDEHHELVACYDNANGGFCDEFVRARGHGTTVVSNTGLAAMEGVAFDPAGDLAVQNALAGTQYFTPAFAACGTDPVNGQEMYLAFDRTGGDIYKSNAGGFVEEDAYAACDGTTLEKRYSAGLGGAVPYGVAVDPPVRP